MQKQVLIKLIATAGLACVLGAGWALGSSRVQDVQSQPLLEIPLYEGAQVEWEVHLTAQEMPKQFTEWAQALSVLKAAGYTIEGERVPEVLSFYERTLENWRWIFWHQLSETDGMRLFTKDGNYLFIIASKRYEATDLVLIKAQAGEITLDVPIFEGAEPQWELLLTKQDLLNYLKQWFIDLMQDPPFPTSSSWGPNEEGLLMWLGWRGGNTVFRLLKDFSELRVVGSRVDLATTSQVLDFYEQQFSSWRRNLWIKPDEYGSVRVFTRSDAQELEELVAFIIMPGSGMMVSEVHTNVIVLRARH